MIFRHLGIQHFCLSRVKSKNVQMVRLCSPSICKNLWSLKSLFYLNLNLWLKFWDLKSLILCQILKWCPQL